ncbi:disulfide bond formation protein DsbA [Marinitenerispora sediminis]|uniref:Disulfide bond formation protein DsbA n=1 Tax=Marinitenerispora sediminis TaxID=1931232 RepID=A0A368T1I5_9ACTN|nr:disulfide bond formation protein DsbA [Marinitenerispora sediminis]RCV53700.1 disulfide bond formation protein DsbA [Marinitenerispora sediminis]RCV56088.1 disulfide bond formation protein DsbA [Marinitenerispora sediminis]
MRIDIWSDVVCAWCYIGKRRLEAALDQFEHADAVELHWHSFQLDPALPPGRRELVSEVTAKKTGAGPEQVRAMLRQISELAEAEGLEYDLDRAMSVNTLDAHRVNHLAAEHGLGGRMHERLLAAQLAEGEAVDDADTLVRLGGEVGLPEAEVRRVLLGDAYAAEVAADIREARRLGVSGVPFYVFDRTYGVSGAQPVGVFLEALRTAYADSAVPDR